VRRLAGVRRQGEGAVTRRNVRRHATPLPRGVIPADRWMAPPRRARNPHARTMVSAVRSTTSRPTTMRACVSGSPSGVRVGRRPRTLRARRGAAYRRRSRAAALPRSRPASAPGFPCWNAATVPEWRASVGAEIVAIAHPLAIHTAKALSQASRALGHPALASQWRRRGGEGGWRSHSSLAGRAVMFDDVGETTPPDDMRALRRQRTRALGFADGSERGLIHRSSRPVLVRSARPGGAPEALAYRGEQERHPVVCGNSAKDVAALR
jgi:hypothetical protein